jgi:hypothetical protein
MEYHKGPFLNPLLFIIFINDLPLENLTSEIDMHADDTTLSINGKNIFEIEATLNEDLNSVSMWCTNNNMVINPTKTKIEMSGNMFFKYF